MSICEFDGCERVACENILACQWGNCGEARSRDPGGLGIFGRLTGGSRADLGGEVRSEYGVVRLSANTVSTFEVIVCKKRRLSQLSQPHCVTHRNQGLRHIKAG